MGVHSGKFGAVNGISSVRNWTVTETSETQRYSASNTSGGKGTKRGIKDWNGSISLYGALPPLPGEVFAFVGYTAPTDDVSGNGVRYSGSAIVDNVSISWNWETGAIISSTVNFSANGALTEEIGAQVLDETEPNVPGSLDSPGVFIVDSEGSSEEGSETAICVTTATLNLVSENQVFANSCTAGSKGRKAGIKDATLSLVCQDDERVNNLSIGDDLHLRIYVDDELYWDLCWMHLKEFSGLTVDRETGAIISQTLNFEKNGFLEGETGHIKLGEDVFWQPGVA